MTTTLHINTFTPLKDHIFVTELEEGPRITRGGIILPDDNFKDVGIRPRWGRVYAVGPQVTDVEVGEWVLVEHGRWTLRIKLEFPDNTVDIWRIDPAAILLVAEDRATDSAHLKF